MVELPDVLLSVSSACAGFGCFSMLSEAGGGRVPLKAANAFKCDHRRACEMAGCG